MNIVVLLILTALFYGCTATTVMYREPFTAKPPTEQIEVYRMQQPSRSYIEIGEISFDQGYSAQNDLDTVIRKAREIGADAIIVTGGSRMKFHGTSAHADGVKAIAIKYSNSNK